MTENMARGLAIPYWLVKSNGRYHYIQQAWKSRGCLDSQLSVMKYLGVEIIDEVDSTGKWRGK